MNLNSRYILSIIIIGFLFAPVIQAHKIHVDTVQIALSDTVKITNVDTLTNLLIDTVKVFKTDSLQHHLNETVKVFKTDSLQHHLNDTVKVVETDSLQLYSIDTVRIEKIDSVKLPPIDTIQVVKIDSLQKVQIDTVKTVKTHTTQTLLLKEEEKPSAIKELEGVKDFLKEQTKKPKVDTVVTVIKKYSEQVERLNIEKKLNKADSLRLEYNFAKALDVYNNLQEEDLDSLLQIEIEARKLLCENGLAMTGFVATPTVVAKQKFSLHDFYLYYPLPDKAWRKYPNTLDTTAVLLPKTAAFVRDSEEKIYFSAADENGINNIYFTEKLDTVWTAPTLLNENLTTDNHEIFPMLSKDGKSLYFSSKGLYGMGGYDLFVSNWDEVAEEWSAPTNLGFPFSSPANDYLLVNTEDSKYTLFASDRGCCSDSVWVYVLEYEDLPVRKAEKDPLKLKELSKLTPISDPFKLDAGAGVDSEISDNKDVQQYMEKMSWVNTLRDSIDFYNRNLDNLRDAYAVSENVAEREKLTNEIMNKELKLSEYQDLHATARAELYKTELDFLYSGVVIDLEQLMERADREIVGESTNYTFAKRAYGDALIMDILAPPVKFDYSFKILDIGQFALDNNLPEGLIYQIQIFSKNTRANESHLKGLSPVFEVEKDEKFIYRVGLFTTYKDVLSNLNKVKKAGFKTAFIIAFNDGEEIAISEAKKIESEFLD